MTEPIQPIVPEGTPLPPAPVGVPPFPITPFAVWTWSSPVIPDFYWNVYSAEQRIKSICKEIGRIEAYLQYLVDQTNKNFIEVHNRIDALTERVAALEEKLKQEVARLDALIAKLREDLEKEIADREDADAALGERIDQEIVDRQHADGVLHEEIAQEVEDRTHADDALHTEISTETQDRIHADDELHDEISHRLLPTDVQAGAEISITRPDPNSNTIIIASTVAHSISELASTVSGLQAALTAETAERRADDSKLWQAVNNRIERGKILAGAGIKVVNDPDSSTVTISATGGGIGGGVNKIDGKTPITVTSTSSALPGGTGSTGVSYVIGVSEATESSAGVITEARVKELAPSYSAGAGIAISGNQISIDPAGSQASWTQGINNRVEAHVIQKSGTNAGKISPKIQFEPGNGIAFDHNGALTISAKTATESTAGVITEARVKELAAGEAGPSLSAEAPLRVEEGTISLTKDPNGPVTSSSAGLSVREITPETESETEAGVVSKKTIKSLAQYSGSVNDHFGLDGTHDGGLRVLAGQGMTFGEPLGYASGEAVPLGSRGLGVSRALPDGSLASTTLVGRYTINPHDGNAFPEPGDTPLWVPLGYENRDLRVASTMVFPWLDPTDLDVEVRAMPDPTGVFWIFYVRKVDGGAFPGGGLGHELREVNLHLSTLTFANHNPTA